MKYTKQDLIDGKVAIIWENDKAKEINTLFDSISNDSKNTLTGLYKYYNLTKISKKINCGNQTNLLYITINQLEEFVLPEKWCIDMSNFEQGKFIVNNLAKAQTWYLTSPNKVNYFLFENENFITWKTKEENLGNYTEITFDQFKQHVLKEN